MPPEDWFKNTDFCFTVNGLKLLWLIQHGRRRRGPAVHISCFFLEIPLQNIVVEMISVLFYLGSDQENTIIGKVVYAKKKNKRNFEFDLYVYNLLSAEQNKELWNWKLV